MSRVACTHFNQDGELQRHICIYLGDWLTWPKRPERGANIVSICLSYIIQDMIEIIHWPQITSELESVNDVAYCWKFYNKPLQQKKRQNRLYNVKMGYNSYTNRFDSYQVKRDMWHSIALNKYNG